MSILIHYMPRTSFIRIIEFHMLRISAALIIFGWARQVGCRQRIRRHRISKNSDIFFQFVFIVFTSFSLFLLINLSQGTLLTLSTLNLRLNYMHGQTSMSVTHPHTIRALARLTEQCYFYGHIVTESNLRGYVEVREKL
jgi:hypothetical protein